ncbi:MAG: DUF4442 domain-containing protein [Pseudomonadota bacterium]
MSQYEMIQKQMAEIVPFAKYIGVEVTHVGPGEGAAELPETPTTVNHIASQHAGALFTVGEAASGAALSGVFADRLLAVRPVAAEAKIAYKKIARGKITATAKASAPAAEIIEKFEAEGKIAFDVNVSLKDQNDLEVATMTVAWHVKSLS